MHILTGAFLITFIFPIFNSPLLKEDSTGKYSSSETDKPYVPDNCPESKNYFQEIRTANVPSHKEYQQNKLTYQKFGSRNYDIEPVSGGYETVYKGSTHTFDFVKQTVTLKIEGEAPKAYSFSKAEQKQQGYVDFKVTNSEVSQIWFNSNNIGYTFKSGKKLVFYELSRLN